MRTRESPVAHRSATATRHRAIWPFLFERRNEEQSAPGQNPHTCRRPGVLRVRSSGAYVSRAGFEVIGDIKRISPSVPRALLAKQFATLSQADLGTSGCLLQAVRPRQ